jgi:hypothetical protein
MRIYRQADETSKFYVMVTRTYDNNGHIGMHLLAVIKGMDEQHHILPVEFSNSDFYLKFISTHMWRPDSIVTHPSWIDTSLMNERVHQLFVVFKKFLNSEKWCELFKWFVCAPCAFYFTTSILWFLFTSLCSIHAPSLFSCYLQVSIGILRLSWWWHLAETLIK